MEATRSPRRQVVVIGGGAGGLAAAYRLNELAAQHHLALDLRLLEASPRVGGAAVTREFSGSRLEVGPDALVTHKPAAIELCRRLGLGDQLAFSAPGPLAIWRRGVLMPMPAGMLLFAPLRYGPLFASPLLSWPGKLRLLAEPYVPASREHDESVASFVRRRFGRALYDHLAEPLVGGIYMADLEKLSLAATLPRLQQLERDHGTIRRGMAAAKSTRAAAPPPPTTATLRDGLGTLPETLATKLPAGVVQLNSRVVGLSQADGSWRVTVDDGGGGGIGGIDADAVVVATPAPASAGLFRELDPELARELAGLAYASCATVHLGWPTTALTRPLTHHGFFLPRSAASDLVAGSAVSVKYPHRVAPGWVVMRAFLGGASHPDTLSLDDEALGQLAGEVVAPLLGIAGRPSWIFVDRHPNAMPQPAVGHLDWCKRIQQQVAQRPGLELAGGPLGAYGLPDVIAAGEAAAERVITALLRQDAR